MGICINFHGVGAPPRPATENEARMWVPIGAFRRILDRVGHDPRIRLTFDDGHVSDREVVLGELARRGLNATFFLVVGDLDRPGRLGRADVRALVEAGMSVGSHGMRHRRWRGLESAELDSELRDSRRELEALAGAPVEDASCPFGAYDRAVLRQARRAGYRHVFTSDGGSAPERAYVQPRTSMRAWDDADTVEAILDPPVHSRAKRRIVRQLRSWR